MGALLELTKQGNVDVNELGYAYVRRAGKLVRILRGAGGRFGNSGTSARSSAEIGSRERSQQRKVQGREGLSSVAKAKRKLGTRRGTLTSRERRQYQSAGAGRQGSQSVSWRQKIAGDSPARITRRHKATVRRALNPQQQVRNAQRAVGISYAGKRYLRSLAGPKAKQVLRIRSILRKISRARGRRRRR